MYLSFLVNILRTRMEQLTNCTIFLTIWMASIGSRGIFHIGLIFCRLTLYKYFSFRFVLFNKKSFEYFQVYVCSSCHRFVRGWHFSAALGNYHLHLFLLLPHHVNSSYKVMFIFGSDRSPRSHNVCLSVHLWIS